MSDKFILGKDGRTPVPCDLMQWADAVEQRRFANDPWRVDRTEFEGGHVSTVFLGLDHQFGEGPPLLFETMIFGGTNDGWQDRYSTWEEAEAGHKKAVEIAIGRGLNDSAIKALVILRTMPQPPT